MPKPSPTEEAISKLTQELGALRLQFMGAYRLPNQGGSTTVPNQGPSPVQRDRKCLWCDQPGHIKRFCPDLQEAVRQGAVKFEGGRVLRPDGSTLPMAASGGLRQSFLNERQELRPAA